MANYDRWGNRMSPEQEQLLEEAKLNKQLKIKQMIKKISVAIVAFIGLVVLSQSCERIDAGHVGVLVNQYGDNKGVDDVTAVSGMVFYNPITTKVYEFPTFIQHKEYRKTADEDKTAVVEGAHFIAPNIVFLPDSIKLVLDNLA